MGMHNRVSPLLKYRVQKEFLVNCSNPNSVRANGGLSKALQRFETEKIKKNLEKSFFNTNKYIRYCEEIQEKSKNIKRGREVVGEMLMKRQEDSSTKDYMDSSTNNPFCIPKVADSLYPLGRKLDFFLKQKILKSLFLPDNEESE